MTAAEAEITAEPGPLTDHEGRMWTWDPGLHSWRHDDGQRTLLRDRADLDVEPAVAQTAKSDGAATDQVGWFESYPPPGVHRLEDTQPWMPAVPTEGWAPPEVHGREPGGAT